jgi:hypothetical protein
MYSCRVLWRRRWVGDELQYHAFIFLPSQSLIYAVTRETNLTNFFTSKENYASEFSYFYSILPPSSWQLSYEIYGTVLEEEVSFVFLFIFSPLRSSSHPIVLLHGLTLHLPLWRFNCHPTFTQQLALFSPPLWSSGQSPLLQIQRSGFDSRRYQIFSEVVGLERSPLSLVSTTEELLGMNISGSGLEYREYGRRGCYADHATPSKCKSWH